MKPGSDADLVYLNHLTECIRPGNGSIQIIEGARVGRVCTAQSVESLKGLVRGLVGEIRVDTEIPRRCKALSARIFAPEAVVKQIAAAWRR